MTAKNAGNQQLKETEKSVVTAENGSTPGSVKTLTVLNADDFFSLNERAVKFVPLSGTGGGFWVCELSGLERDRYEQSLIKGKGTKRRVDLTGSRARLVIYGTIHGADPSDVEKGIADRPDPDTAQRVFTMRDLNRLNNLGAARLEILAAEIRELSGISESEDDEQDDDLKNDH